MTDPLKELDAVIAFEEGALERAVAGSFMDQEGLQRELNRSHRLTGLRMARDMVRRELGKNQPN